MRGHGHGHGLTRFVPNSGTVSGVFDEYGVTPVWLYSTLQLTSDATQRCVQLTRGGDSATSDFTPAELEDGTAATWSSAGSGDGSADITVWYHQTTDASAATTTGTIELIASGTVHTKHGRPCPQWSSAAVQIPNDVFSDSFMTMWLAAPATVQTRPIFGATTDNTRIGFQENQIVVDDLTTLRSIAPGALTGDNLYLLGALYADGTDLVALQSTASGNSSNSATLTSMAAENIFRLGVRGTDYYDGVDFSTAIGTLDTGLTGATQQAFVAALREKLLTLSQITTEAA